MIGYLAFCCATMANQWAMLEHDHVGPACQTSTSSGGAARHPDESAHISFAGGAIQLPFDPQKWTVAEVPAARQILLTLTRDQSVPGRRGELTDGLWIAYTHMPTSHAGNETLRRRLASRSAWAVGNASTSGRPQSLTVDGRPAVLQDFSRYEARGDGPTALRGFHLVAHMSSGWLDVHWVAPAPLADARRSDALELLEALQLSMPQVAPLATPEHLAEAAPLVGSWKAPGAVLSLSAEGAAALRPVRKTVFPLNELGRLQYDDPILELTGTFESEGDVLAITWQDGSRLNVRWRVDNGQLFLTDHEGRVRQLGRLFR